MYFLEKEIKWVNALIDLISQKERNIEVAMQYIDKKNDIQNTLARSGYFKVYQLRPVRITSEPYPTIDTSFSGILEIGHPLRERPEVELVCSFIFGEEDFGKVFEVPEHITEQTKREWEASTGLKLEALPEFHSFAHEILLAYPEQVALKLYISYTKSLWKNKVMENIFIGFLQNETEYIGTRFWGEPFSDSRELRAIIEIAKQAGIDGKTPHMIVEIEEKVYTHT